MPTYQLFLSSFDEAILLCRDRCIKTSSRIGAMVSLPSPIAPQVTRN
ncbi:MAG: hypothetical protein LH647_19615 [Leptolyngbyaceae cyanobacterium CAN_BIN12]|nr:hypothetical protein [Leptolyngbyaceae cyanobacterium CAN_BIN12]